MLMREFMCLLIVATVIDAEITAKDVQFVREILRKIPKEEQVLFLAEQLLLGYAKTIPSAYKVDEQITMAIFKILTKNRKIEPSKLLGCDPICFTPDQCIDPCDPNIYPP